MNCLTKKRKNPLCAYRTKTVSLPQNGSRSVCEIACFSENE